MCLLSIVVVSTLLYFLTASTKAGSVTTHVVRHNSHVVQYPIQPFYQSIVVPAYSFQYLPAVSSYTSPVVPPISALVQQEMARRQQLNLNSSNLKEVVAEVLRQLEQQKVKIPNDGMPVVFDPSTARSESRAQAKEADNSQLPDMTAYALQVLQHRCARCHTEPGRGDVFLFTKQGVYSPNTTIASIYEEIRSQRMPPGAKLDPDKRLPKAELDVIEAWASQSR